MNNLVDGTRISKLRCVVQKSTDPLFFSLVDYRNNLFTSDDPDKIIEFYRGFDDRKQLIKWMRERPKGAHTIYEVNGDKDIIVVITTADYNGKFAKECRQVSFKGLHIIFVESGGKGDFYFNYSHNCNFGIRKGMEYQPKWIVVSNDDMFKIDDTSVLLEALRGKDENRLKSVFTHPSQYHSSPVCNGKQRAIMGNVGKFLYLFLTRKYNTSIYFATKKIAKRFDAKWFFAPKRNLYRRIFYLETRCYVMTGDFSIFSGKWARDLNGEIFNETYLNGVEDWELSLQICGDSQNYDFIDYKIGDLVGGTIGDYIESRQLRDIANMIYFDSRINEKFSR